MTVVTFDRPSNIPFSLTLPPHFYCACLFMEFWIIRFPNFKVGVVGSKRLVCLGVGVNP